jgi:hypothetical protein
MTRTAVAFDGGDPAGTLRRPSDAMEGPKEWLQSRLAQPWPISTLQTAQSTLNRERRVGEVERRTVNMTAI